MGVDLCYVRVLRLESTKRPRGKVRYSPYHGDYFCIRVLMLNVSKASEGRMVVRLRIRKLTKRQWALRVAVVAALGFCAFAFGLSVAASIMVRAIYTGVFLWGALGTLIWWVARHYKQAWGSD